MEADVTVVIPAMDREHFIGAALRSVSEQTVHPREVIVVDDGSSDGTAAVAEGAGARVIRSATNHGSGVARNRGIDAARTEWIAFLDSDDTWEPQHLEELLRHTGELDLVSAPGTTTDGHLIGNTSASAISVTPFDALTGDLLCTSGTMVRRRALIDAGGFGTMRRAQDLDTWVRVLERGPGLALATPTFVYSFHDAQAIRDTDLMRTCVDEVVEGARRRGQITPRQRDVVYVRRHWDDARTAQRAGFYVQMVTELAWIALRPHTWRNLTQMLAQRYRARRG